MCMQLVADVEKHDLVEYCSCVYGFSAALG